LNTKPCGILTSLKKNPLKERLIEKITNLPFVRIPVRGAGSVLFAFKLERELAGLTLLKNPPVRIPCIEGGLEDYKYRKNY